MDSTTSAESSARDQFFLEHSCLPPCEANQQTLSSKCNDRFPCFSSFRCHRLATRNFC